METARRLLRASPVLKAFIEDAELFQGLGDKLGLSAEKRRELFADMVSFDLALELEDQDDECPG